LGRAEIFGEITSDEISENSSQLPSHSVTILGYSHGLFKKKKKKIVSIVGFPFLLGFWPLKFYVFSKSLISLNQFFKQLLPLFLGILDLHQTS